MAHSPPVLTLVLVSCGCTLLATGFAIWQAGNARAWERQADAAELRSRHWQAMALRVPRQPALTTVMPMYHAPRSFEE